MNWIKITNELPPSYQLVWVKRFPNRVENEPVYLAYRQGSQPLATNPDASQDCYWRGDHYNALFKDPLKSDTGRAAIFQANFSDVSVLEWAYVSNPLT